MKSTSIRGFVVLVALALIQGCMPGYNSVLFATRSNLGFDADTNPPNLEVAFSRYEGVLQPTFEGGQTLPVMASFSSKSGGFKNFFWGVDSTFATGQAAYIMSYLYADPQVPDPKVPKDDLGYSKELVTLSKMPNPKRLPFGKKVRFIEPGDVKPVVFGTDTILGVKVKWSGMTAQYPSSVNIGFKRKEATWAPIAIKDDTPPAEPQKTAESKSPAESAKPAESQKHYTAEVASLLATLDSDVTVAATDTKAGTTLRTLQYFATGAAANNLARQPTVRQALLAKTIPDFKPQPVSDEEELKVATNRDLIRQICNKFGKVDESNKENILQEAKRLKLVDEQTTIGIFKKQLYLKARNIESPVPENLNALNEFARPLPNVTT